MTIDLTDRELDVMSILWELDGATVAQVRERLSDDLAYTSVLSALQLLEHKGHITHERAGRAFRYLPLIAAEEAGENLLDRMLSKLYRNSPVRLMAHLDSDREVSDDELLKMRRLIDDCFGEDVGDG